MSQSYSGDKSIIAQENKLLRERLEKAEADTRRLDDVEARRLKIDPFLDGNGVTVYAQMDNGRDFYGETVREAIDIAAQAKP